MKTLFLIPARGGSKGIPHKNIKLLCGKPLIHYSIDLARELASDEDICISTDDPEIKRVAEGTGITVPFLRPAELATDRAGTNEVIMHAIGFYKEKGIVYDRTVLLQPTSPLRTVNHVREAMALYDDSLDMVVSVRKYENSVILFRESDDGFLQHVFDVSAGIRRQDAQSLYEYNGAIYVINNQALQEKGLSGFRKNKKYVMPEEASIDIDTNADWEYCEYLLEKKDFAIRDHISHTKGEAQA
ncbi:MAG: acylneuraminate cytidylyltransferase family protein [Lachnospiraceae bacterium]|nr:acylneuraminate cytidylyltransferase family protein [Lachnospiraceae bacterium]